MKTRKFIAIAMTALMSLSACKKVESDTPQEPAEDLKLKVTASLYQFTKATDTAFEENDAIGLYMFNPETYAENVKYTVKNGALPLQMTLYGTTIRISRLQLQPTILIVIMLTTEHSQ